MSAFLGATINSTEKFGRQIAKQPGKTAARTAAWVVLPAAIVHLTHHYEKDEEGNLKKADWYENLPKYKKDIYTVFNMGDTIVQIPKGFDYGIMFGNSTEAFIDFLVENDPDIAKDLFEGISDSFLPGVTLLTPDFILPFVEVGFNRSLFKEAPLIPKDRENLIPEMMHTPYTTELAKAISAPIAQFTGLERRTGVGARFVSPASIEAFIGNWSGTIGMSILQTLDDALQSVGILDEQPDVQPDLSDILGLTSNKFEQDIRLIDIPIVRAFITRNPSMGAEPVQKFFAAHERNEGVLNSIRILSEKDPLRAREI